MPSEAELNDLRAVAEHQRQQADVLLDAVPRMEAKVERARYAHDTALEQLANAKADAHAANNRATEAERAADEAGAPPHAVPSMTVNARPTP